MKNTFCQKKGIQFARMVGFIALVGPILMGSSSALAFSQPLGQQLTGNKYVVKGKIINAQGENYWIRKSSGEDVRLTVTKDTNMVCHATDNLPAKSITTGNPQMKANAQHNGFRIGNCPPEAGQYIKAETTDLGTVSFLRTYKPNGMMSHTERLGLPQQYSVFPVVQGELKQSASNQFAVRTEDGTEIGKLKKVIIDTGVGDIVYGVVELDQRGLQARGMELAKGSLMPAPWNAFQVSQKDENIESITIKATANQLAQLPAFGKDMSALDVRAYWELYAPDVSDIGGESITPEYHGADRVAELELKKERARVEAAQERYLNSRVRFEDDLRAMERAQKRWEDALLRFKADDGKTIQQELQSQIFR